MYVDLYEAYVKYMFCFPRFSHFAPSVPTMDTCPLQNAEPLRWALQGDLPRARNSFLGSKHSVDTKIWPGGRCSVLKGTNYPKYK